MPCHNLVTGFDLVRDISPVVQHVSEMKMCIEMRYRNYTRVQLVGWDVSQSTLQIRVLEILPDLDPCLDELLVAIWPPAAAHLMLEAVHVGTCPGDVATRCLVVR